VLGYYRPPAFDKLRAGSAGLFHCHIGLVALRRKLLTMELREGVSFIGCQAVFVEYFSVEDCGQGYEGVVKYPNSCFQEVLKNNTFAET